MSNPSTYFKPGQIANPNGRPKGSVSPFTRARTIIMRIFQKYEADFEEKLEAEIQEFGTITFYRRYVEPIAPKAIELTGDLNFNQEESSKDDVLSDIDALQKKLSKPTKNCAKRTRK